jgi:hypothetical protein
MAEMREACNRQWVRNKSCFARLWRLQSAAGADVSLDFLYFTGVWQG